MKDSLLPYVDADPNGDTEVILMMKNTEKHSIRVSSKVLSLASPVFAALLGPNFAEGNVSASVPELRKVILPEDDPMAMTWIFWALHFHQRATSEVELKLLEKIATVCDRYDLSRALRSWGQILLEYWENKADDYNSLASVLRCSVLFRNNRAFYDSSLNLLSSFPALDHIDFFGIDHASGLIPWQLFSTDFAYTSQLKLGGRN